MRTRALERLEVDGTEVEEPLLYERPRRAFDVAFVTTTPKDYPLGTAVSLRLTDAGRVLVAEGQVSNTLTTPGGIAVLVMLNQPPEPEQ